MKTYGYVRVSSPSQCIDRQMIALKTYGVPEANIFVDKASGKNFDRPAFRRLLKKLHRGDLLCVKSIDRLGRNCEEIQEQWRFLTQKKGVDIVVLDNAYLDTRNKSDFMHEFMNHMFLYVMSFTAENERLLLQQRQAEGIAAAKRRGVHFGRKCKPLPEDFLDYCELYLTHKMSCRQAAEACGMAKSTFMDAVKRTLREKKSESATDDEDKLKQEQDSSTEEPEENLLKKISEHIQNLLPTFSVLKILKNKMEQKELQKKEKQQKSSLETTKIPDGNV